MKIIFDSEQEKEFFEAKNCPSSIGLKEHDDCGRGLRYVCFKCWEESEMEYEIKNEESIKVSSLKEFYETSFVDLVYETVKNESRGLDSIYRDYIINLVGVMGLNALIEHKLVEGCGIINGRKLYVLCERSEDKSN